MFKCVLPFFIYFLFLTTFLSLQLNNFYSLGLESLFCRGGEGEMEFEFWEPGKIQGKLLRFMLICLIGLIATGDSGEMIIGSKGKS